MVQHDTPRGSLILDPKSGVMVPSHPLFEQLAEAVSSNTRDFLRHEAVFLQLGLRTNALMAATVHKTVRGQAAGGVRLWPYATVADFLTDGLRLSVGMSRKNALAGLWWGGGKGVIARPAAGAHADYLHPAFRAALFADYGAFISSLRGCYVTAGDAGVNPPDVATVFQTTRHTTCIPPAVGGSGDPSVATGLGVVCAMEAAVAYGVAERLWPSARGLSADGSLAGLRVAVQGAGNVARHMAKNLLERHVAKIVLTDISDAALARAQSELGSADGKVEYRKVSIGDDSVLLERDVDIVSPCALGGTLNHKTIPKIKAKIVCGAANNQLLDDATDDKRFGAATLYVPDFVANRMGIVNCANEQYGTLRHDPAVQRHFTRDWENSIFIKTHEVLRFAKAHNVSSAQAARTLADELCNQPHPIWGGAKGQAQHRGWSIIQDLRPDWHTSPRN